MKKDNKKIQVKFFKEMGKQIKISIEGGIAAGKSKIISILEDYKDQISASLPGNPTIEVHTEPVESWMNLGILQAFLNNPEKYAFSFQCYAYLTRVMRTSKSTADILIIERCVETDRECFAKNLYDTGVFDDIQWAVYSEWYDKVKEDFPELPEIDKYVYLQTTVDSSIKRIKTRARDGEEKYKEDYLKSLLKCHDDWLLNKPENEVVKLDMTQDWLGGKEVEYPEKIVKTFIDIAKELL